jgi:alcohol dehydrogenase
MSTAAPDFLTIPALLTALGQAGLAQATAGLAAAPCGEVRFGLGIAREIGAMVRQIGGQRVLVVTDPGIAQAGHLAQVLADLEIAGLQAAAFTQVLENPDTRVVDAVVAAARAHGADSFIGLGGGSSMDAAKGANFILTNGGQMQDYRGKGLAKLPMLPFIAVPTTSGTGSECQSYALISDAETHVKMACGDPKAAARIAVLDPLLTVTQPPRVTRLTGLDALSHALESAVCTQATPLSRSYSQAAFALLAAGFPQVCAQPQNLTARAQMLAGAALAGVAIENSMLGAAHATANPLTAVYGVPHGAAVGVMLAPVLRLNFLAAREIYDSLAPELPAWWLGQLALAEVPSRLRDYGVTPQALPELALAATQQWTGTFNPVPLNAAGFEKLYQEAW